MAIAPIEALSNSISAQAETKNDVIDKNEFLLLLVTQLQNQDPLNPMDYAEFTSQTAQFASLEQLQNINENLGNLQKYQSALFDEHAVSLIGKTVRVYDNTLEISKGTSDELRFELEGDAREIYAYVYDSSGDLVRELKQTGNFTAGEQGLAWDGTDDNGKRLYDGKYFFEVQAVDTNGITMMGTPVYENKVTSVNFWDGTAYLIVGDREVAMGNVLKVTDSPADEN